MKKILTLILGSAISSSISYADTASANYIKHYLQIVYPTSNELQAMSESQIQEVYTNELNTWFRVPMPSFESGLFANITPQYRVFVFPDTAARTRTDLANKQMLAKNGFNSQEVILGSNKNYIEVSSLAWMNFPFGAYFNWAHGSGIYLNTEGKTISGYTKVDILYKIYLKNNQLDQYYTRLATSQMVQGEIFASNLPLEQLLNIYAKSTKVSDYAKSVDYIKFTEQNFHIANGAMPLAVAILGTSEWDKEKQTQFANLVADKQYNKAYRMLLEIYVNDHKNGTFDQKLDRFKYLCGEASTDLDEWMYDSVKAEGYNVAQMTYQPNFMGQPTFELVDVRWPKISNVKNIGDDVILKGIQNYDLEFSWNKASQWLSIRDPYDLMNNQKSQPVKIAMPDLNQPVNSYVIQNPPKGFPESWLPQQGWSIKTAKNHYHATDTLASWVNLQPAPQHLALPHKQGRFVTWGLSNESGFSFTNIEYNIKLLNQHLSHNN